MKDDFYKDVAYLLDDMTDNDEAFRTVEALITVQPERAAEFWNALKVILQRHNEEECKALVKDNANRYVDDGAEAFQWLFRLQQRLEPLWMGR